MSGDGTSGRGILGWVSGLLKDRGASQNTAPPVAPPAPVEPAPTQPPPDEVLESAPPVGTLLGGRYLLNIVIGKGGAAVVYHAHDQILDHDVAIKVLLLDGIAAGPDAAAVHGDLRTEARMALALTHPSIVRIYNYEKQDRWEYIVMEYVEGESLRRRCKREPGGRLPPEEVVRIGVHCLGALEYAHSIGVIHNDIKPANILLTAAGAARLCDFGLARVSAMAYPRSPTGTIAGTAAFMPPERIRGESGDARSDIYALGATLYTLGNGIPPFGNSMEGALKGHLSRPVPPSVSLPTSLHDVLAKAMSKDPADRYANAGEMCAALSDAISNGEQIVEKVHEVERHTPMPVVRTAQPAVPRDTGRSFHLREVLGRGAFGEVFLAEQDSGAGFRRSVAIKLLHTSLADDEDAAMRIRDEARILGRLAHRHIVNVVDLVHVGDRWAVVMDYVAGADLEQVLEALRRRGESFPAPAAIEVGVAVLEALHAAYHTSDGSGPPLRIIHRDIKPSNIRLTPDGDVKVLDFGVARANLSTREAATGAAAGMGTPRYLAPERVLRLTEGPESDVYAAMLTLAELILGQPVGRAPAASDLHFRFIEQHLEQVRQRLEGAESTRREIIKWLRRGLAAEPSDRPDAREAADLLRGLASELKGERLAPFARRYVGTVQRTLGVRREEISGVLTESAAPRPLELAPPRDAPAFSPPIAPPITRAPTPAPEVSQPPSPRPVVVQRPAPTPAGMAKIEAREVPWERAKIAVPPFFLDLLPVTNAQYAEFLIATDEIPPAGWFGRKPPPALVSHPVVGITLAQARAYAKWRGKRLPTEPEWLAASGHPNTPWGTLPCDPERCQCARQKLNTTAPVGAHPKGATAEGVLDLYGNTWEWTEHDPRYPAPQAGYAWVFGSSFKHPCTPEKGAPRSEVSEDNAYPYLGLRCARDAG